MFSRMIDHVRIGGGTVILTQHGTPQAKLIPIQQLGHHPHTHVVTSREARDHLKHTITTLQRDGVPTVIHLHGTPVAALTPVTLPVTTRTGDPVPTTVITFFSHAGGVGKTSSCRDIGYELGTLGHKVLAIDLDPQANLTTWLGVDPEEESAITIYDALVNRAPLPPVHHVHGIDLIPADLHLANIEVALGGLPMGGTDRLKKALEDLIAQGTYDFILIDTPPSLGKAVAIALFVSDEVIIPVSSRNKGVMAIETVHNMVNTFREWNPKLNILSHLITQRNNTRHSREASMLVLDNLPNVTGPIKSRPAVYDECQVKQEPVGKYAPRSEARDELHQVVEQLLHFLGRTPQPGAQA